MEATRCVTLLFSGVGTQSWTADRDCYYLGNGVSQENAVVGRDPALTYANYNAPAANKLDYEILSGTFNTPVDLKLFIPKGNKVYVAVNAAGPVTLYLGEVEQLTPS